MKMRKKERRGIKNKFEKPNCVKWRIIFIIYPRKSKRMGMKVTLREPDASRTL